MSDLSLQTLVVISLHLSALRRCYYKHKTHKLLVITVNDRNGE